MELYLAKLREELSRGSNCYDRKYIDLADKAAVTLSQLFVSAPAIPPDNLSGFQEMLMKQIVCCNIDKVKVGINELLKHLIQTITTESEPSTAQQYLFRLRMIFQRCLLSDFPYPEDIWNYICNCLKTVGVFLTENGYFIASQEVIDFLAAMGRVAALRGLPTANTQSSLRILENKALEKGEKLLASNAKNARFNLET